MLKKIAIEAYNIHYRENRGITREDLVNRFQYSIDYAKKIIYEYKCNYLLIHLEGHKQGRFKEYFLVIEIERFLQKQVNNSGRQQQLNSSQLSVIQILVNGIIGRKPTFHKLMMMHVKIDGVSESFDNKINLRDAAVNYKFTKMQQINPMN